MPRATNEAKLLKLQAEYARLQNEIKKAKTEASRELRNKRTKTLIEVGAMALNLFGCGDSKSSLAEWEEVKASFAEACKDLSETGKADELKKIYEGAVAKRSKNAQ